MFERITIREVHKDSGEKMRILFDLSSQNSKRVQNFENFKFFGRSKVENIDRSLSPVALTKKNFILTKKTSLTPSHLCKANQLYGKRLKNFEGYFKNKRNITEELLMGIDQEVQNNTKTRKNKPNKLKFIQKRLKIISLHKISAFDCTVPEAIKIESKSPLLKK
jgi:hypothetical protein